MRRCTTRCAVLAADPPRSVRSPGPQRPGRDAGRAHPRDDRDRPAHDHRPSAGQLRRAGRRRRRRRMGDRARSDPPRRLSRLTARRVVNVWSPTRPVGPLTVASTPAYSPVVRDGDAGLGTAGRRRRRPRRRAGSGADQGAGVRDLRERPAHARARRRAAAAGPRAGSRVAARPDASDPVRARCRHRDGARVLLRGRRAGTRREQPRRRDRWWSACRRCSTPTASTRSATRVATRAGTPSCWCSTSCWRSPSPTVSRRRWRR